jgi:hypothetical protein
MGDADTFNWQNKEMKKRIDQTVGGKEKIPRHVCLA